MQAPTLMKGRYEIQEILAQGGMSVVCKAYDTLMQRTVALKVFLDITDANALKLFQEKCADLASLIHPNIVEIYDTGQLEDSDGVKPYLVMPLLAGVTLDRLIGTSSPRLTVESSVDMICQVCQGLQAAHERGLVHGDIKSSNIFVLDDDSTKIVGFDIARGMDAATGTRSLKAKSPYSAPEQVEMQPVSALSDVFSLGVVCYETLTRRKPFERPTEESVADAILNSAMPPVSELNPAVNPALSQAIHKAMAKQPWHRYCSAQEFGETLQKALRNEPIEIFNLARIRSRVERAAEYCEMGDLQFASEILGELEAEGHLDSAIADLRRHIEAKLGDRKIRQLLESATSRMDEDEYPLALAKVVEVLQLDAQNPEALSLKSRIENRSVERDLDDWFRLAQQHIETRQYSHARDALQRILRLRPKQVRATQLLAEVESLEPEYVRLKQEKEQNYRAALEAEDRGEISSALSKLERVLELDRLAPDTTSPGQSTNYADLYNKVRSESEAIKGAYAEARKHLEGNDFSEALAICGAEIEKYPGNALFQALKFDIEERQRQAISERSAETGLEEKAGRGEQIDHKPESGEYSRAQASVKQALPEDRGDAGLAERERLASQGQERGAEARRLSEQGLRECAAGNHETGLAALRQAYGLDRRNGALRDALLENLVEQARRLMDENPASAEAYLKQALELESGHALVKGLSNTFQDRRRQEEIDQLVSRAWQLLADGDVEGARDAIRAGLTKYPNAPRLSQLQESLDRKFQELRQKDLDELRRIERESHSAIDPQTIADYSLRLDSFAQRYEGDAEFQTAVHTLSRRLQAVMLSPPGPESRLDTIAEAAAEGLGTPAPPAKASPGAVLAGPGGPGEKRNWTWIVIGVLAGLLAVLIPMMWLYQRQKSLANSAACILKVGAAPSGAEIFVDGQDKGAASPELEVKLAAGTHELEARMPGYSAASQRVEVKAGGRVPVNLVLNPNVILRLFGPVGLKASIDGGAAVDVPAGRLLRELTAEKHSVRISNGRGAELEFSFEIGPAGLPTFPAPPRIRIFNALLVSNFGRQTRIVSGGQPVRVRLNGQPAGVLGKDGLDLPGLAAGTQRLELGEGNDLRKKSIDTGAERTVSVLIDSDPNTGNVLVDTGLGDTQVEFLRSGKVVLKVTTAADGKWRVQGLPAFTYDVQVSKPGFEADAPRKSVKVLKGQDQTISFQLHKLALFASVVIRTNPGARVFVDGKVSGTAPENGLLQVSNLALGEHKFEAQSRQYSPKSISVILKEGSGNPEILLRLTDRLRAAVAIVRTPGSGLSYRQQGAFGEIPVMEKESRLTLSLPEGGYTFSARLEDHEQVVKDITLVAGETVTLDLQNPLKKGEPGPSDPMEAAWGKGAWQLDADSGWYVRKSPGWLAFPRTPVYGIISFTPAMSSGGRLGKMFGLGKEKLEWRLSYVNEKNYLSFVLKDGSFESSEVVEGKKSAHAKSKGVRVSKDNNPNIQIVVTPAGIEHSINGQTIDKWDRPDSGIGAFGFMVDPNKPLLLQNNFRFEPSR